jgi:hypothetical protein
MGRIQDYPIDATPENGDILLGTNVLDAKKSKNYSIQSIVGLVPVGPTGSQGIAGPSGPIGPVGPAGLNWKGVWNTNTSYIEDDVVSFGGSSWFCISPISTSGNDNPTIDISTWSLLASQGAQGVQGPQGPTGAQGIQGNVGPEGGIGPVGPAGLNWRGSWSSEGTYVEDDAVAFEGASWFCINNVSENDTPPPADTSNWALLASQGAQGPAGSNGSQGIQGVQGIQGIQGVPGPIGPQGVPGPAGTITFTNGSVSATTSQSSASNVLLFDFVTVTGNGNQNVRLPENQPIGKVIQVTYNSIGVQKVQINVRTFDLQSKISINSSNSNSAIYYLSNYDTVKFISRGSNFWTAEYVSGTNLSFNDMPIVNSNNYNIVETIYNGTTSELSLSQLNTTYPSVSTIVDTPVGLKVYCPNISTGGLVYVRVVNNEPPLLNDVWVSMPIEIVA